jgi:hypothetical protein
VSDNRFMEPLLSRVRAWTAFFIVGLVLSGLTALPIPTAFELGSRFLGEDLASGGRVPAFVADWLRTARDGVRATQAGAPFVFYGTDWLAFGHLAIALVFVGAWREPVRNRWLYAFGMMACAAVVPWALVFGHVRGIPPWWRAIDASFGVVGFVPVWLCHRWTGILEARTTGHA